MKLIFNPFFDEPLHIDSAHGLWGVKYVGSSGLLSELELRLGLNSVPVDQFIREVNYKRLIKKRMEDPQTTIHNVFGNSFAQDPLGVTSTLLSWRDALVMVGWDPHKTETGSDKLDALAELEPDFDRKGLADRFVNLLHYIKNNPQVTTEALSDMEIQCMLADSLLPKYFQILFTVLKEQGVAISDQTTISQLAKQGTDLRALQDYLLNGEPCRLKGDGSVCYHEFHEMEDAIAWVSQQKASVKMLQDTATYREYMRFAGKALNENNYKATETTIRLLNLGLKLYQNPVNIQALLSYLSIRNNPLYQVYIAKNSSEDTSKYISLGYALQKSLLTNNGISDEWENILKQERYQRTGEEYTLLKKSNADIFINMWERATDKVAKKELLKFIAAWKSWANKFRIDRDALFRYCEQIEYLIEDADEQINIEDLLMSIERTLDGTTQWNEAGEVGTDSIIASPLGLTAQVDSALWIDHGNGISNLWDLSFLTKSELQKLGGELMIVSSEEVYSMERWTMAHNLAYVKDRMTFVRCKYDNQELVAEHPLITELKQKCRLQDIESEPKYDLKEDKCVGLEDNKITHQLPKELFAKINTPEKSEVLKRDCESYSSINTLIHWPFNYVVKYLLKWSDYGVEQLATIETLKGNVAHKYFEDLVNTSSKNIEQMQKEHNQNFDNHFERLIVSQAALLNLEQNHIEKSRIKAMLNDAINALIGFIRDNGLEIVDVEKLLETEFGKIGRFQARIDLILKDSNGKYIIVDLKWNEGSTYNSKLKENKIMQLVLYKKTAEYNKMPVRTIGYFVLPKKQFLTNHAEGLSAYTEEIIPEGKQVDDPFTQIENSYEYRMSQIQHGIIEDGELCLLSDIPYALDTENFNLYPLETDYKNKQLKGQDYGQTYLILKGGIEKGGIEK